MLILIAEDFEPLRRAMCRILQPSYEACAVADGTALLDAVSQRLPDVVLLDISMPGLSGMAAARQLRTIAPELKLIFVTDHAEPAYVREALALGVSGYLLKRALATELTAAVGEVLAGRQFYSPGLAP